MDSMIDRIAVRMEELGMTPAEVARKAGLNHTYVRDILMGKSKDPKVSKVQAIADVLGVTIEWLIDGRRPVIDLFDHMLERDERLLRPLVEDALRRANDVKGPK